ncbi:MAG: hypothetical protein AAF532_13770 [Planctomycetota bacterium]
MGDTPPTVRPPPRRRVTWVRRVAAGALVVALIACVATTYAYRKTQSVPDFYEAAAVAPADPDTQEEAAAELAAEAAGLERLLAGRPPADEDAPAEPTGPDGEAQKLWRFRATGEQLNAWLARELGPGGRYWDYVPVWMSTPRLGLEEGAASIGARLNRWGYEGVLSVRLRGEPESPTLLRFDIDRVRVGTLTATPVLRLVADELGPTLDVPEDSVRIAKDENGSGISVWIDLAALAEAPPNVSSIEVTAGEIVVTGRVRAEGDYMEEIRTAWASADDAAPAGRPSAGTRFQ